MFQKSLVAVAIALVCALPALADPPKEPPTAMVAIYHVAPGKHVDFLKWMAAREAVGKEAGLPAVQWYAHMDGDSWDYVAIAPKLSDADTKKADELAKKKGLKVGPMGGIEFRALIASHTDTVAAGPLSAAEILKAVTTP